MLISNSFLKIKNIKFIINVGRHAYCVDKITGKYWFYVDVESFYNIHYILEWNCTLFDWCRKLCGLNNSVYILQNSEIFQVVSFLCKIVYFVWSMFEKPHCIQIFLIYKLFSPILYVLYILIWCIFCFTYLF